jgi:hypothetical protein
MNIADLMPGVIYRIRWNGHDNDMIGTFLDHHPTGPRFTNVNYRNVLDGERPRKIATHPLVFDPTHFTFYKSGDTLQRKERLRKTLHELAPGLGKQDYFGGKRKRTRKRYRS